MNPNTKGTKWVVIINDKKEATEEHSIATFRAFQNTLINYSIFSYVATMIHDDDFHDNGDHKRVHLHAFIETEKMTLKEALNQITELLKIEKEQISIEATNNEFLGVQYLTHKNDPNKTQYDPSYIITSNALETERRYGLKYETEEEKTQRVLENSSTLSNVIKELGVEKANKYRGLFNDLAKERRDYRISTYDKTLDGFVELMNSLIEIRKELALMDGNERVLNFRRVYNQSIEILEEIFKVRNTIQLHNEELKLK